MRRSLIGVLVCVPVLLAGCSSDGPTQTDTPRDEPLATATIGPAGGTLFTDDFILTVPEGAFGATTELELRLATEDEPYTSSAVTDMYRVDGLPSAYQGALRLALRYEGELSGDSYIAIGQETMVHSLGDLATSYAIFEATDSSGFLVYDLALPEAYTSSTRLLGSAGEFEDWVNSIGLTNFHDHRTPEGNFEIIAPRTLATTTQMENLGSHFENAYNVFLDKGFDYSRQLRWPIPVYIRQTDEGWYGYFHAIKYIDGYRYIAMNVSIIDNPDIVPFTAGHEFLHLVQSLYDPRPIDTQLLWASRHIWLDEATAVYSEEFFADNPDDFVSSVFRGREYRPFFGIHIEDANAGEHGYGMASMIKYLTGRFLSSTLLNYYEDIMLDKHPVEAVIFNADETTDWVPDYYRDLLQGEIYNVQPDFWFDTVHSSLIWKVDAATDTLHSTALDMHDMSANTIRVDLDYPEIDESARFSISLTGSPDPLVEVTVFEYDGAGGFELIDDDPSEVVVSDIRDLTLAGHDLLALITNRHAASPYTATTYVPIKLRVFQETNPTGCYIVARDIDANFLREFPSDSTDYYSGTHGAGFPKEQGAVVNFTGTTLTQTHDYLGADGNYYTGTITVTFDATLQNVTSFTAQATISKGDWIMTSTLSGQNIPLDAGESYRIYKATGPATCTKITGMTWSNSYRTYTDILQPGWTCNSESELEIWIFTN
jgi:hypothetical protein